MAKLAFIQTAAFVATVLSYARLERVRFLHIMVLQATRGTRYTLVFCIIMIAGYVVKVRSKHLRASTDTDLVTALMVNPRS